MQCFVHFLRITFLLTLCFVGAQTHALIITEVMYDSPGTDTDHEWIEIYNDEPDALSIETLKLFEANVNHGIVSVSGESEIPSGEYAIIAANASAFAADYPSFSGIVTDSSFSLSNTGETLAIKYNDATLVSVTYDATVGAAGNGSTLSFSGGSWIETSASPGGGSGDEPGNDDQDEFGSTNATSTTNSASKKPVINTDPVYSLKTTIEPVIIAGDLLTYKAQVSRTIAGDTALLKRGIYRWSMGDGSSYEVKDTKEITHTYAYAGTYQMIFEYYTGALQEEPLLVYKKRISVIAPTITVSGSSTNGTITLQHSSGEDFDASGWHIVHNNKVFTFPSNTFFLPKMKYTFTPKQLGFAYEKGSIILNYPNGDLFKLYQDTQSVGNVSTKTRSNSAFAAEPVYALDDEAVLGDLSATVLDASQKAPTAPFVILIIFIVLVGTGVAFALYALQRKTLTSSSESYSASTGDAVILEDIVELSDTDDTGL